MLPLKALLKTKGVVQARLGRLVGVSPATIAQLVNHGIWPTNPPRDALQASITAVLTAKNIAVKPAHFEPVPVAGETENNPNAPEGIDMLLRKQTLSPQARKHFGLFRDPFDNDVQEPGDVFVTPDIRYVREAMWSTAKLGGFIAVAGESGSGKSTLRRDLIDRIGREDAPIVVMEPYVLGMEDNDLKGKTLKAGSIADAMIHALAPLEKPRMTIEAKGRQLHRLLKSSRHSGFSHCLIIEEAHGLSVPTLKHLKRFFELEDGFKKLLSIILIGQTELKTKLSERAPEVREVVQRCELIELNPLDSQLDAYLRFKFARVGKELDDIFEKDALDGIRARLIFSKGDKRGHNTVSLMYPLMVNNLVAGALNQAATLGFPKISADLIKEA
ncbi:AAA family ATPase [Methylomicrobium sp. Wu6]|uniref:ExeA family protein n=1 Tax=Methylomicrobium sp. Wu6 TaxID=3107928 RepID=UPI002DD69EC4|nr:AAA family ATPase [Methylomicrobium sp. Wu6]MEC4750027.1 AAA family ATPase [Methylomicrobium sp. Wu6]